MQISNPPYVSKCFAKAEDSSPDHRGIFQIQLYKARKASQDMLHDFISQCTLYFSNNRSLKLVLEGETLRR